MPYRTIKQWPNKCLEASAETASIQEIKEISVDLIDTLRVAVGAGLAAPQINISKRVLVIDTSRFESVNPDQEKGDENFWVIANPKMSNLQGEFEWKEACLSVPLVACFVKRSETLTLEYDDINGESNVIDLTPPLSLAVQHEVDHLDGKTILNRISRFKANMHKRKIRKSILKSLRAQTELEKINEPNIGRVKKKSHLSAQERKKRKQIKKTNSKKK